MTHYTAAAVPVSPGAPARPQQSPLEGEPTSGTDNAVPHSAAAGYSPAWPHLLLQHHADRALLVQLLPELDHLPPQILSFLVFPDVR